MAENGINKSASSNGTNGFLGRLRIRRDAANLGAPPAFGEKIKRVRRTLNIVLVLAVALPVGVLLTPVNEMYTAEGLVQPKNITNMFAATDLEQREGPLVAEGDRVEKGQVLMRFYLPEREQEILGTSELLATCKADLVVQKAKTATMKKLPLPKELWEIDEQLSKSKFNCDYYKLQLRRAEDLAESGDISAQEVDRARLQYKQAEIEQNRLTQRFKIVNTGYSDTLMAQTRAEESRIASKIGSLTEQLALLKKEFERLSELRAPAAGVVLEMPHKDTIGIIKKGEKLAYMALGDERMIQIFGPQENFDRVALGQMVRFTSKVYDSLKVDYAEGRVFKISKIRQGGNQANAGATVERYYSILATIEKQPQELKLDSNVMAEIILSKQRVANILFGAN